ncbi:MAG: M48 family metalloprotease [Chloroflexota bacterium]|nr:M48 family metalloprotease [Chloroflexota bacterium]
MTTGRRQLTICHMASDQHEDRAGEYVRLQIRWRLVAIIAELLFLAALTLVVRRVGAIGSEIPLWQVAGPAVMAYAILMLPIVYHLGFRLPHRFCLTGRRAAYEFGVVVLARGMLGVAVPFSIFHPRLNGYAWWWAYTVGAWAIFLLWKMKIMFCGRRPFRHKPQELQSTSKTDAMQQFAREHGFENLMLLSVHPVGCERAMYAASGSYKMQPAVYLSDNMIEDFSLPELQFVIAHELAHLARRNRLRAAVARLAVVFCILACTLALLNRLAPDARSVLQAAHAAPVLLLVAWLADFILSPVLLADSRRCERRANAAALEMTNNPAAMISAMNKLARSNLASGRPGWLQKLLFTTHPSLCEVVSQAQQYAAQRP